MLTPPEAFGTVESGIYRCAVIDPFHFAFLDTLGLHSIIVLNLNRPPKVVRSYAAERNIDLVHMGLRPWRSAATAEWMVLSHELIMDALTFVLDTRNHPVLVLDATNAFIGTLRRAQHWNFSSVLSEYRAFSGGKPHYMTELFLELLDIKYMDHTEALTRRQSIEGMANAAIAAAAVAATQTPTASPSLSHAMLASSNPSAAASQATLSPSQSSALLVSRSPSSTSLAAAAAAIVSSPSGIATPRSRSFSATSPSLNFASLVNNSNSPVPTMTREHYSNVLSREDSAAVYDSEGSTFPGGHSGQGHVVVLLPPTEYLPAWFKRQQALWERDRRKREQEDGESLNQEALSSAMSLATI
ncbi:uncharacterized protein SAPINGB_P003750 [Magnusiomyces paraingens]|uniref:Tyrosine-protein phosphatase domain-containing protein n=1 Tax=Magnusiomyces paraingens TaxID=2606893 RepID=A0A5E8BT66_9ASCO|nr:uncharacterized protein SAPINGB_P003750 [Saprochaete ingens]VVT53789.1 unnamed protein product [Saprochaete ingens]